VIPALAFLQAVPRWVWGLLAVVALVSGVWLHGRSSGKAACEASYARVEAKAEAKAERVSKRAQDAAIAAKTDIRKESDDAQAEVRTIVRTLPATCPDQPDRLRELGRAAVESAGREVLPASGR